MDTLAPDAIGDEKLRWLYKHWRAKGRERAASVARTNDGPQLDWLLPRRDQIDPLELDPGILPHILLAELVDDASSSAEPGEEAARYDERGRRRWRFRLVGTTVAKAAGFDPTWHFLDEALPGAYGDYVLGLYDTLRHHRMPIYSESAYMAPNKSEVIEQATSRLMLPLTGPTETTQSHEPAPSGIVGRDSQTEETAARDLVDPVHFVLSGQVFINHTTEEKRGVLVEGPFDQGLRAFIDGD
ncbi:MAG: hypothetical protein ACTS10_11170 [Kiloniellales bacterium]